MPAVGSSSVFLALLPIMATVLAAFLVIGLALPVLPLHVRGDVRFGSLSWGSSTVAGLLYVGSLPFVGQPGPAVAVLLAGRAVLGGAESFIITGATVWGLARVGTPNAGKVIAWMGTAMFLAFVASAPLGIAIYGRSGFFGVAGAIALAPLLVLLPVAALRAAVPSRQGRASVLSVVQSIWLPGAGAALSSIGFGVTRATALLAGRSDLHRGQQRLKLGQEPILRQPGRPRLPRPHAGRGRQWIDGQRIQHDAEVPLHGWPRPSCHMMGLAGSSKPVSFFVSDAALGRPGRQRIADVDRRLQPLGQPEIPGAEMRLQRRDRVPAAHQRLDPVVQQLAQLLGRCQVRAARALAECQHRQAVLSHRER